MFTLHCVDRLQQHAFVLELVALSLEVEGVIDVLVDFLRITHLVEKTAKYTCAAHPHNFKGETGIGSTTALSSSCKRLAQAWENKKGKLKSVQKCTSNVTFGKSCGLVNKVHNQD